MSKQHPRQWEIHDDHARPAPDAVAALAALPTTQIADCGAPIGVVGPGVAHVAGGADFCGPAVTVWTRPGDILFVLKAPDLVSAGDVLVVDGGARLDAALLGDFVTSSLRTAGAVGCVVDGVVRDVEGLDEVGVGVFARGAHPATGSADGPGALNVVVTLGGVPVHPGDVVRADRSGVVVVPRERVVEVLAATRAVEERERGWRAAVDAGATLAAATGLDDVIAAKRGGLATDDDVALP